MTAPVTVIVAYDTEFYEKLRGENIITSLREGNIRVSPYVYNSERDIDRLVSVVTT